MPPPSADRPPTIRRWTILTAALLVSSLLIRVAWLSAPHALQPDSLEYLRLAHSLTTTGRFSLDGQTFSTYRPPLYPLLIAAAESVTARPETFILAVQCVLGALTVGLTMMVARRFFGEPVALVTGALLAIAPMTGHFAALMLTETLFTFLVLAGVFAWRSGRPLVAGVAFGAAALTRASLLPYILLIGAAGLIPSWRHRRACLRIAAAALVVMAPWVVRNAIKTGRWTVADAGWGTNLLIGTLDLRSGSNRWVQIAEALPGGANASASDAETDARSRALAAIRTNPLGWIRTRAGQWVWLFIDTGDYLPVSSNRVSFRQALRDKRADTVLLKAGFASGTAALVFLALCGGWTVRRRLVELAPLWSFPVYLAAAHLPMYVEPRYGLPLVPFLATFASVAIVALVQGRSGRSAASHPEIGPGGTPRNSASVRPDLPYTVITPRDTTRS
jgi:4-amino-4-deoxy-L-arabinose transferase-like glycosyltransferase